MLQRTKMQRRLALLLAATLVSSSFPVVTMANGDSGFLVNSLTLQPGETTTSINLNWYAPNTTTNAQVKVNGVVTGVTTTSALRPPTEVNSDKYKDEDKIACKATIGGLEPDTTYTYQISNDGGVTWSQEYIYKTPAADSFKFAFTSDPQIKENGEQNGKIPDGVDGGWDPNPANNQTGWAKLMEVVGKEGVSLMVSAGDQVEDQSWGKTSEYDAFFAPEEMTSIAYAPAVGNHDRHYMFDDHFNLPNEMPISENGEGDTLQTVKTTFRGQNSGTSLSHGNYTQATDQEIENQSDTNGVKPNEDGKYDYPERREMETKGNYYYLYNNVLFVTLNTGAYPGGNDEEGTGASSQADNAEAEAIVANFDKTLTAAKEKYAGQYDWVIVTHHKSTQTVAKHAADSDIENYVDAGFERLMEKHKIDFVLGGHDHVYSRSYVLDGEGQRVSEALDHFHDPQGTIYLTANCSSDMQYYTPFQSVDKSDNVDYPILANGKKGSAAYMEGKNAENPKDYLPIGNQEWHQEYSPSYGIFEVEGNTISVKVYNLDGDSEDPSTKLIDEFTVTKNKDGGEKASGFNNSQSSLAMAQIARYDAGMTDADGGVMEIVDYNKQTGWAYAVNGKSGMITAIPLKTLEEKEAVDLLDGNDIDVKALVNVDGFEYGDMTSVAISPDGTLLAAAIQAEGYADNGRVALFTCNADGSLSFLVAIETGVQPDMVTFTPDGTKILTANEGEPREGYSGEAVDPKGSVTIINTADKVAKTVDFTAYDSQRDALVQTGIILKKGTNPSVDLEPEYIACNNDYAYVTLQEANAIAVLDLAEGAFNGIYSAGLADYSKVAVDIDKKDEAYAPKTYESLRGIRMPDAISLVTINGVDYVLTANEGDSRSWGNKDNLTAYSNEIEVNFGKGKASPTGKITVKESGLSGKVVFFDSSDYDGLADNTDYLFGGRSFTMYQVTDNGLVEVFDSKNDFESLTAKYLPEYFNCSNDDLAIDDRSGKKGPEPETVTIGKVGNKTFACITLERIGGVMVYDITNPAHVTFVNYINSRDFSSDVAVDDSPEGLKFIPASESPTGKALLMAACEVGGTVAVYEMQIQAQNNNNGNDSDDDFSSGSTNNTGTSNIGSMNNGSSNSGASQATAISKDSNVTVSVATVNSSIITSVENVLASDKSVTVVGSVESAVSVSAKSNGNNVVSFIEPVSVKVPVSQTALNQVNDTSKLTLALVTQDAEEKVVITKVGGNYDAATNTFTALINKAGDYVLLVDNNIKKLELTVGSTTSKVNGTQITNDVAPIISNGRTLVPVRYISETLGAKVNWNNKTITLVIDGKTLTMTINKNIQGYNVAPMIYNNRAMVPIRYISDQLGANIIWSPSSKQINITK